MRSVFRVFHLCYQPTALHGRQSVAGLTNYRCPCMYNRDFAGGVSYIAESRSCSVKRIEPWSTTALVFIFILIITSWLCLSASEPTGSFSSLLPPLQKLQQLSFTMREPPRMDPQSAPCSKRAILGELSENVVVAVTSTVINEKNCQSISTLIHDESNPIDTEHLLQQLTVIRAKDVEKGKRIAELEREVGQCRKRERAIRDVFLDLYSGTKEKNKEEDRLKGRATKLKAKYKELRRDQKDLENDQLKFEENKLHFKAKLAPRNAGEESFSVYNYKYGSAQMKLLGEVNPWSAGKIGRHFVMGEPLDIWKGEREEFLQDREASP